RGPVASRSGGGTTAAVATWGRVVAPAGIVSGPVAVTVTVRRWPGGGVGSALGGHRASRAVPLPPVIATRGTPPVVGPLTEPVLAPVTVHRPGQLLPVSITRVAVSGGAVLALRGSRRAVLTIIGYPGAVVAIAMTLVASVPVAPGAG
ncbi:MAG: hypothetical protein M3462_10930, partial [Chloroflexota bacterium]|nr:hypothetical protein [Chloroflexota bacterium]